MTDEVSPAGPQMVCGPGECLRACRMRDALLLAAKLIERDYSLGGMEAAHDGHPIEKDARAAWDAIWAAFPEDEGAYIGQAWEQDNQ